MSKFLGEDSQYMSEAIRSDMRNLEDRLRKCNPNAAQVNFDPMELTLPPGSASKKTRV